MRNRGSPAERGYGTSHRKRREALKPTVDAGQADCWRCGHPIEPGEPWDLGHDDHDRSVYRGPEHRHCNRGSAAARGNRQRVPRPVTRHSREWLG